MDAPDPPLVHPQSQLFTLRLWVERLGKEPTEVRIQVRHVLTGETRYFREWTLFIMYVLAKLQENDPESNR